MKINIKNLSILSSEYSSESLIQTKKIYQTWGCFIAKSLFTAEEIYPILNEISQLISLLREQVGFPKLKPGIRFDHGFNELIDKNPKFSAVIYNACRRLTSVHQLSVDKKLLALSKNIMQTDLIMSNPYKSIRIDFQQRENYLLPWHQDYPYVQDSPDALIYWIPLHNVDEQNGCIMLAPGSQQLGILPVYMHSAMPSIKNLDLKDDSVVKDYPNLRFPLSFGDVLVFNSLLLHRSYPNLTNSPRWTLQIRHGNFKHPFALKKHWPGSHYEQNWFDNSHPEYVVSKENKV